MQPERLRSGCNCNLKQEQRFNHWGQGTMATTVSTDSPAQNADRLRAEMRQIRRELGSEVEELVEHAERLMDWRYYVNRYPWAVMGAATLLGYFVVPHRTVMLPTDEHTLSRLAERIPVTMPKPEPKRSSWVGSLMNMAAGMAWKAALAYATQQVGKVLGDQASATQKQEFHHGQPTR